jgi:uncharacterized protein (DUF1499 family)
LSHSGTSRSRLVPLGLGIALFSAAALALSGPGYRMGWFGLQTAFAVMRWAAYGGIVAIGVMVLGAFVGQRSGNRLVLVLGGMLVGLVVIGVPWYWLRTARRVPPIHDITTDTANPPSFVAILPLRESAPNPATYGGPDVARLQKEGYPNLRPVILNEPHDQAFQKARAAAHSMGWDIVASDAAQGRIEATATTFWFGFKDDIVVRVTTDHGESRIDIRSVSRVGRSDVGTNAGRIEAYEAKLKA